MVAGPNDPKALKISLVLADVDGTLVTKDKVLTVRAVAAVQALHAAGIAFAITSGRPPRGMAMLIEPLALDEAYLDVTENRRGLTTASATATEIRTRILQETGLTASAGVSYNKFLAKLASGQRKPNGQFVITPERGGDFIASLPVARFHGVGPVTAARMQRLGIETGADLRAKSRAFLQQHFGKSAAWYLGIANGEDDRPVVADRPRKSSGSETTFERDLTTSVQNMPPVSRVRIRRNERAARQAQASHPP